MCYACGGVVVVNDFCFQIGWIVCSTTRLLCNCWLFWGAVMIISL
jgi:hypothetical protein